MDNKEKADKLNKFFSDPDWKLVEEMVKGYLEPLRDISTLSVEGKTADQIMAEVTGRQITIQQLDSFLTDALRIKVAVETPRTSFK